MSATLRLPLLLPLVALMLSACSAGAGAPVDRVPAVPTGTARPSAPAATITRISTAIPTAAVHQGPAEQPLGFPIDPATRLGLAVQTGDGRAIRWGAGPEAEAFTRDDQPSSVPERASRSGWNCRVHVEYEGQPAVDWYVPVDTPIFATMDGTATLHAVTVTNAFDHYGVDREPYLGDPDRARAAPAPFPGPGGGKGVFLRVENAAFVTEYAHLDLPRSVRVIPVGAFLSGYDPDSDYAALFASVRDFRTSTPIARWTVKRGDLIGFSGDSGYSEAPHLHYTVRRAGNPPLLCPTTEAAFEDGGWLVR